MAPPFYLQPTPLTVPTYLGALTWDNNMILYQAAKLFPGDDSAVVKAAEHQAALVVSPRLFPAAFLSMAVGTALQRTSAPEWRRIFCSVPTATCGLLPASD